MGDASHVVLLVLCKILHLVQSPGLCQLGRQRTVYGHFQKGLNNVQLAPHCVSLFHPLLYFCVVCAGSKCAESELQKVLLKAVGQANRSISSLQCEAAASLEDGGKGSFLTGLGTKGKWRQNVERDLHRRARQELKLTVEAYEYPVTTSRAWLYIVRI